MTSQPHPAPADPAPGPAGHWVLLSYRVPRHETTRRIGIWRKLERLGVARLGDGLVGLPADARTREHLEWAAEQILEAGGTATVWLATTTAAQEHAIAEGMRAARAAEYTAVQARAEAAAGTPEATRQLRLLRAELRRIARRDFFPPPERDTATAAVQALATGSPTTTHTEERA